jgi:hypothetical protein
MAQEASSFFTGVFDWSATALKGTVRLGRPEPALETPKRMELLNKRERP